MDCRLLDITTQELLEKFGAGNHKPGSGSAAAFQGMIAAKLLVTVISLTNDEKRRRNYSKSLPRLLEIGEEIQNRIFPELTRLFEVDSVQFDKTIKLRKERDAEDDIYRNNLLALQALEELKINIETPLEIAQLNIELANMADFVFDHGFQSARGDSHVALSGAISGLAGCLSIIQLNLTLFGCDEHEWSKNIIEKTDGLKKVYQKLHIISDGKIEVLENEVSANAKLHSEVNELFAEIRSKNKISTPDIELYTSKFQKLIWRHRSTIWKKNTPKEYIDILKPSKVFEKVLGYQCHENIKFNKNDEIAGIIDQPKKLVLISNEYPVPIQNFTIAHELGHALLHEQSVLHRDKPVDGSKVEVRRNIEEFQADKFAALFLMPGELVRRVFKETFGVEQFILNEDSTFFLTKGRMTMSQFRKECRDVSGLALKLASADNYFSAPITPIAEKFGVSVGAMAIRLEELQLLKF